MQRGVTLCCFATCSFLTKKENNGSIFCGLPPLVVGKKDATEEFTLTADNPLCSIFDRPFQSKMPESLIRLRIRRT